MIYLAGSLRNPNIISIAEQLQAATGQRVFADWYAAGPEADDHWKAYYEARGFKYRDALKEAASTNVYLFDKRHIDEADAMVLVLPAGKSGHLELGYHLGKGKPGYILLDGNVDRWDVMYQFATGVTDDPAELIAWLVSAKTETKRGRACPDCTGLDRGPCNLGGDSCARCLGSGVV